MKRKYFNCLLILEAFFCLIFVVLYESYTGTFSGLTAFPFEQIGIVLRRLSLTGKAGNALSIFIYTVSSLLPFLALLLLRKKRSLHLEDSLLAVLSIALFAVLYLMINPGYITLLSGEAALLSVYKSMLGSVIYSIVAGYFVLHLLRHFSIDSTKKLIRYTAVILHILAAIYVYIIAGISFGSLFESFSALSDSSNQVKVINYLFLTLQFLVDVLPYVFSIMLVFAALDLLQELVKDRYSAKTITAAASLSKKGTIAISVTVLSHITFNLLQLLFIKDLLLVHSTVTIPIFAIIFILSTLLLTHLITESKNLKDEHDLFI